MKSEEKLDPAVIASVYEAIQEAGGNEVFCVGTIDQDGNLDADCDDVVEVAACA